MSRAAALVSACLASLLAGCPPTATANDQDADAGVGLCGQCLTNSDCVDNAVCLQLGGADVCALNCNTLCTADQFCKAMQALDGTEVNVCVPATGSCSGPGCGTCPAGQSCNYGSGHCSETGAVDGGLPANEICNTLLGPDESACCPHNCGTATCQTNGCFEGWWCDTATCHCSPPPTSCGASQPDAGHPPAIDAGHPPGLDAGQPPDASTLPAISGTVTSAGGSVSRLFFAVTGDTRPNNIEDTAGYPTAIIGKIFQDVQAMNPRPQFMVATGDYMFTTGSTATTQAGYYAKAMKNFSGPTFVAMGNHECDGYTTHNCSSKTTQNLTAYKSTLLAPLGKTQLYYTVNFQSSVASFPWTAKMIVLACNAWDSTQSSWLTSQLKPATTYTFVVRHEPTNTQDEGPCDTEVDSILTQHPVNMLLMGHSHEYEHLAPHTTYNPNSYDIEVVGVGGAPPSGTSIVTFGYATIEQIAAGFKVTQYAYDTALPIFSAFVPF